jgi:hypothetical protein
VRALIITLILGTLSLGTGLPAAPRLWRDTGGRALTGTYLTSTDEHVFLKLDSGKTSEIPLGLLSNRDLEFVRAKRAALSAQGIRYEAPLVWESYRSKKFTASQVEKQGYYPLESDGSQGILRLLFQRYGPPPSSKARVVLRLHTASAQGAGTTTPIRVQINNKVVGAVNGAPDGQQVDIPLPSSILATSAHIEFTVHGGTDAVFVRTRSSGKAPQLLVLK